MLKLEAEKWYFIAILVIVLLVIAFVAPYIGKSLCAYRYDPVGKSSKLRFYLLFAV